MADLSAENAYIFRITHIDNLPWILDNGLHCQNSKVKDPDFIGIGMQGLIERRKNHDVHLGPRGTLSDYIPFYFTPFSIMMFNIVTGYHNVIKRSNSEIAILVSSLHRLARLNVPFVFTNGHAYLAETEYFDSVADLDLIDWRSLQNRDFGFDPNDPGKKVRYQAEALVFREMAVDALFGVACHDDEAKNKIEKQFVKRGLSLKVEAVPKWYF